MANFFQLGMKVNIEVMRGEENLYFSSKVEEVESGNLVLGMPIKGNQFFHIRLNESINVHFPKSDSFFYIVGKVVGKKYIPIPVLIVKPMSEPIKNQRRDFFRIRLTLKVKVKQAGIDEWKNGYVKDLSGSGALIATNCEFKKGDILNLQVPIMSKDLDLKSEVVRSWREDYSKPYNIAVRFIDLEQEKQDEIIKFILTEQRKMIKRGYK